VTRRRAVLVEDDPHIAVLVEFALEPLGLLIERFADGAAALERLRRAPRPDVAILDLMLPGRSGREILGALDEDERLAALPVLVLSARVGGHALARARGPLAFVAKPFDVEHLLTTVERLLAPGAAS
jgi:CheY-like chemotaxis protein